MGNQAVDRLLEATENPRHRFLPQAYHCDRFLSRRSPTGEEIFAPA
ncbi:hypothetical protein [Streptomyces sp. NPDC058463]